MNEHLAGKINSLTRLNLKRGNWEAQLLLIDTQLISLINLRRTSDGEGGEGRGREI